MNKCNRGGIGKRYPEARPSSEGGGRGLGVPTLGYQR